MSAPASRPSIWRWIYNHNPFYAISAVLMLYAVRAAYGELEIGAINSWRMMSVLAGYTALLALIAVLIIRWGKVWEDARSILILMLLLFLGVSISADDLFVRPEWSESGTALLHFGFWFSVGVTEAVLWGSGIRLGAMIRLPFYLLLSLFFMMPWWCSPELHERSTVELQWTILLFPAVAGAIFLGLLPAVRRGPAYVDSNGTPWRWPLFPWIAFGVMAIAVGLRSYILSMTFGFDGPIWNLSPKGRTIVFDTIWGPYFLLPLAFSILVLLLEGGLSTQNPVFLKKLIRTAPVLLLLSLPYSDGVIFREFLETVTSTVGGPLWISLCLLLCFYAYAWLRRVPEAGAGVLVACLLTSVVGMHTIDLRTLTEPQPWPFGIVGVLLLGYGLWNRSSLQCAAAAIALTVGLWFVLPESQAVEFRFTICFHAAWAAVLVVGLAFRDDFAAVLRFAAAVQMPLSAFVVATSARAMEVPFMWRIAYIVMLAAICFGIALLWRSRSYAYAFALTLMIAGYWGSLWGFHEMVARLGRAPVTAFTWSMGTLLLAFLLSAHKARWLHGLWLPAWWNDAPPPSGHGASDVVDASST